MQESSSNNNFNSSVPGASTFAKASTDAKTLADKSVDKSGGQKSVIKLEGRVMEALPNAFFKILLPDGRELRGFLSGKMKLNRIKILPGDKVSLEVSLYDQSKGRIVYRLK